MDEQSPGIGHNNPPDPIEVMVGELRAANADLAARAKQLLDGGERFPERIEDEETSEKATTFSIQLKALLDTADGRRKEKGRQIREFIAAVDGFFASEITGKAMTLRERVRRAQQDYLDRKDAAAREAERQRRDEEAKAAAELKAKAEAELAAAKTDEEVGAAMQTAAEAEQVTATVQARAAAPTAGVIVRAASGAKAGLSKRMKGIIVDRAKIDFAALAPFIKADHLEMAIGAWIKAQGSTLAEGPVLGGGVEAKLVSQLNERGA